MTTSPHLRGLGRRPRADAVLWAASLLLALSGVVLGGLVRPAASSAASAGPRVGEPAAPAIGRRTLPDAEAPTPPVRDRVSLFRERIEGQRDVESAMDRAFDSATPARMRIVGASGPAARVTPGASPDACLAQAVYYEARGETAEGQAAVAQVVLNRSRSGLHPADLCGVVFEGAARPGCQFSFACDPRLAGRRTEPAAWRQAQTVASEAIGGQGRPELAGALNYHADYVRPRWAAQMARAAAIGRHIFYAGARQGPAAPSGWSFAPAWPAAGA